MSSQVKSDLVSQNIGKRWYKKEWEWAQGRRDAEDNINDTNSPRIKIIPVVIGDYRFSEAYHQQLPSCITAASAFETAKDSIDHLIRLINS